MKKILLMVALCSMLWGMDAEELIAKNIEARGGIAAWKKIKSLKVTGEFQAFSVNSPFTMYRSLPNRYLLDHSLNGKKVIIGYDGETLWWENLWFGKSATEIRGLDRQVLIRDVLDYVNPFFEYKKHGYQVEYLGDIELDGMPALGLKLIRKPGEEETWYFDAQTFLEMGCDGNGSDFGQPVPFRTMYDEFQKVGEVVMPFIVESQFYTRDRVMEIKQVEFNVDIPDEVFDMPLPMGIADLKNLAGDFNVEAEIRRSPRGKFRKVNYESSIELKMKNAYFEEHFVENDGEQVTRTLSFDAGIEMYRLTQISTSNNLMLIMQGSREKDSPLVVNTMDGHTVSKNDRFDVNFRLSMSELNELGFRLVTEVSIDNGESWFEVSKAAYTRKAKP